MLSGPFGRFFRGRATKPAELAEEDVLDEDVVIAVPLAGKPPAPHTTAPRRIHRVS
jgi:hypothetical protein